MNFFLMNETMGTESGPFSLVQIQEMVNRGKLKKNSLIRQSDSTEWQRAGVLLANLFVRAEAARQAQKQQAETAKAEAKQEAAQLRAVSERDRKIAKRTKLQEKQLQAARSREFNRGTLTEKVFGRLDPSPYWGFQIQALIINIAIGLVLLGTLVMFLVAIGGSIISMFTGEMDIAVKTSVVFFGLAYAFGVLIWGFLTVVGLVFIRNVIDWMIDMEAHAHALRKKLTNETA